MAKRNLMGFVCLLTLIIAGCERAPNSPPIDEIVIAVTGTDYNWHFQYPGQDGMLGTADDLYSVQNLFLPDHSNIKLQLASEDYLYTFALPELGLKEIAVPEMIFELDFQTGAAQTMVLLGDQFCGFAHDSLKGRVRVLNQDAGFYNWPGDEVFGQVFQTAPPQQTGSDDRI